MTAISPPRNSSLKAIARVWNWFTAPHPSLKEIGELRAARLASSFTFAIAALTLVGFFASSARVGFAEGFQTFGFTVGAAAVSYVISRSRYYRVGIFIFTLSFCASGYINIINSTNIGDVGSVILIYVPLGLIVAGNFLPWPAVFLLLGLNVGAFFGLSLFGVALPENTGGLVGIMTTIGIVLIVLKNFQDGVEKARLEELRSVNRDLEGLTRDLEARVQERTQALEKQTIELETRARVQAEQTKEIERTSAINNRRALQFQALSEVSRTIASIQNLNELLPRIASVISTQFGFYHVGIFFLDEAREYAVLVAVNSEGGRRMLARNHRLRVGQVGIVGNVTGSGKPRIALDTGKDAVFFNNPDLPDTHSEMALPLLSGKNVIGALDVQSIEVNAFSQEDVEVLSTLADQVSIAIQNARLFDETQKALAEAEAIYRQSLREAWSRAGAASQAAAGFRYNLLGSQPLTEKVENEVIAEAIASGTLQVQEGRDGAMVAVPIILRGETIGVLNVRTAADQVIDENDLDVVRAVAERVAISAENARLFEETTSRAERERTVADITNKIRATNDPQEMINTALDELKRALKVSRVQIVPYAAQTPDK